MARIKITRFPLPKEEFTREQQDLLIRELESVINQLNFSSNIPGVLYGQCSEICGSQHSHIPIAIELIKLSEFNKWVSINVLE